MLNYIKEIGKIVFNRRARKRFWGFRPVVMCIIQASEDTNKFLFITPASKPSAWMPPQEGIEPTDTTESAILRCLRAELGVQENQLQVRRTVWLGDKEIPEQRGERDVPFSPFSMRGKAYYAALVKVPTSVQINHNPAEVNSFEWISLDEVKSRLSTNSERKIELLKLAFAKLLKTELTDQADD